jgi:hypothetical protein
VFGWNKKPQEAEGAPAAHERSVPTKVLPKFLAALTHRDSPVILDLGPVVGSNVSFLGERLGCKIFVEDLFAEIERATREGTLEGLPAVLAARFGQEDGSIDGILCWDLFDFLDKASAQAVGTQLARILTPGGVLTGFFAAKPSRDAQFTRYVINDEKSLVHRPYKGVPARPAALQNRDIAMLFPGLKVTESFLLLTQTREILFRKG